MPQSLRDTVDLPSARGTRQMPKNTWQTIYRVLHLAYSTRHWFVGKQLFAECFLSHTRQMVCRVSNLTLSKKKWFFECFSKIHSAKDLSSVTLGKQHTASTVPANSSLPSVFYRALGKDFAESWNRRLAKKITWRSGDSYDSFAECQISGTRQTFCIMILGYQGNEFWLWIECC